jgi:hypothetical protein
MKNSAKNSARPQNKHLKPFPKGVSGNPDGRPLGQKNYATLRSEAIIQVGKANGKTPEEIEIMLHSVGISRALKGEFNFYKDDMDRTYGQATAKTELKADVSFAEGFTPEEQTKLKSLLNGNRTSPGKNVFGNAEGTQIPGK